MWEEASLGGRGLDHTPGLVLPGRQLGLKFLGYAFLLFDITCIHSIFHSLGKKKTTFREMNIMYGNHEGNEV